MAINILTVISLRVKNKSEDRAKINDNIETLSPESECDINLLLRDFSNDDSKKSY